MTSGYFDASALLPLFVEEARSIRVRERLAAEPLRMVISRLAAGEVASGLSRLVRMRELAETDARARLDDFDLLCRRHASVVDTLAEDIRDGVEIVRRFEFKLLMPDAVHVATARRLGLALATFDKRLAQVAEALGVGVLSLA